MNIEFEGKIALVTGGSSTIGRAIALGLASHGAVTAIQYFTNEEAASETVRLIEGIGGRATAFRADLADVEQINLLVKRVNKTLGSPIDILVNNAGRSSQQDALSSLTEELYLQLMDTNFKSCVFLSQAVVPAMIQNGGGNIVNIASAAGHTGGAQGVAIYSAAKAAMLTFTKNIAKELAGTGIRINAISPGAIANTPPDQQRSDEVRKFIVSNTPLRRAGLPEDVANSVLFLASDLASFMTGESLFLTGGLQMR